MQFLIFAFRLGRQFSHGGVNKRVLFAAAIAAMSIPTMMDKSAEAGFEERREKLKRGDVEKRAGKARNDEDGQTCPLIFDYTLVLESKASLLRHLSNVCGTAAVRSDAEKGDSAASRSES